MDFVFFAPNAGSDCKKKPFLLFFKKIAINPSMNSQTD